MVLALLHGFLWCFVFCSLDAEGTPQVITDVKSRQGELPTIEVEGRAIKVNGEVLHLKGVCWNPVPKGATHPEGIDYSFTESDTDLMVAAGINAVRIYVPITNHSILDVFHRKGIWVIQVAWAGEPVADLVPTHVNPVKDHPAILMYEVVNGWNYNKFYYDSNHGGNLNNYTEAREVAVEAIRLTKQLDPSRPVATVFGEMPSQEDVDYLHDADIWGLNMYRGKDFGDAFLMWHSLSEKPMYVAEYGCDAFNSLINSTDFDAQAVCTKDLTNQIVLNSVKGDPLRGVSSGGIIFALADEWYKAGDPDAHDNSGAAPGGGPWPDFTSNEEWWGLMDVNRAEIRPAYHVYAAIPFPTAPPATDNGPRNVVFVVVAILAVVTFGVVQMAPRSPDGQTEIEVGSA